MRIVIFLLLTLIAFPAFTVESLSQDEMISSNTAVSQTGRFAVTYFSPLIINKEASAALTNFLAYQDAITKSQIIIGAIPGDDKLSAVCKNPIFLQREKIADVAKIADSDIHYFKAKKYRGCVINFNNNQSALIVVVPASFINQAGETIKHIGIVGDTAEINKLKNNIYFDISAKDYFLNLLQIGQAFSPFSHKINWHLIKKQGMAFIGNENITCRGLSAAAKFLTPALHQQDLHSFVSLNGLGSDLCPSAPLPEDERMKKWFAVPEETRKSIIKYSANFHGDELNSKIAYLYIPAMEAFDPATINKKITEGRNALANAQIDHACGLIVDLRFNYGGSVVPMLLTLGGVLSSDKLFSLGKFTPIYLSEDKNKLLANHSHEIYGQYDGPSPRINHSKPIAILTNWMTASSGNITSLALRDNAAEVRVFGGETSPTTSVNATFYLLDGNTFNLTVDRFYDKKDNIVPLALPVDEVIEDHLATIFDLDVDATLHAAKNWLESLPVCQNLSRESP